MIKLSEVFMIAEVSSEDGRLALEQALSDPEIQLTPLVVNPLSFPGEDEWKYFEQNIEPILTRNGWVLEDEHLPVVNKKHWKEKGESNWGDNSPLADLNVAVGRLVPVSQEAKAAKKNPELLRKANQKALPLLKKAQGAFSEAVITIIGGKLDSSAQFKMVNVSKNTPPGERN